VVGNDKHTEAVTDESLHTLLGTPRYRDSQVQEKSEIGLVTGLAWTEMGGSILQTEVQVLDGKGKMTPTGQLGDVMQESAHAALTWIRSRSHSLGLPKDFYRSIDIHVHVPEGAIPKDGPSAGITMATALASALTKIPVRRDIAMTGEITLRGKVLPIGGLKEKLLAAHRAGIREAILPAENKKDLADLPQLIKEEMKLNWVEQMDEVLEIALTQKLPKLTEELPEVLVGAALPIPVGPGAENVTRQ
jgi:ATP-dependent Lon protease